MKIALVFRSGGDYNASDVQWLVNQLPKGYEIICLTDLKRLHVPGVKVVPLINQWQKCRGWWAKIELFRPDITDDLFYLDLDTVIAGDIRPILEHPPTSFTMLGIFTIHNIVAAVPCGYQIVLKRISGVHSGKIRKVGFLVVSLLSAGVTRGSYERLWAMIHQHFRICIQDGL